MFDKKKPINTAQLEKINQLLEENEKQLKELKEKINALSESMEKISKKRRRNS